MAGNNGEPSTANIDVSERISYPDLIALIRNEDKSLRIESIPVEMDGQTETALMDLAREMQKWDRETVEKLVESAQEIDEQLRNRGNVFVTTIASRYMDLLREVYRRLDPSLIIPFLTATTHNWWQYPKSVSSITQYFEFIEKDDLDTVEAADAAVALEAQESDNFMRAFAKAHQLKKLLHDALEAYCDKFDQYVSCAEGICPGIFARKNFCRKFNGQYGTAELDWSITPGNQTIVEHMAEYLYAYALDNAYDSFEKVDGGALIAGRPLGWYSSETSMDQKCDLSFLLKSNLGYGASSYFHATLKYRGVSAINAVSIIFYSGIQMAEFARSTSVYEVDKDPFTNAFEDAQALSNEYLQIGEAAFVDKYFLQSIRDLADLLAVVANMDTFLQVTTVEKLNNLLGNSELSLVPNIGFENASLELNDAEKALASELAGILADHLGRGEELHRGKSPRADELLNRLMDSSGDDPFRLLVKRDLVRNELVARTGRRGAPWKIDAAVERLIPKDTGMFAKTYEGYDLIAFRIEKASKVLPLLNAAEAISGMGRIEEALCSLRATCLQIRDQAADYWESQISPELQRRRLANELLREQIDGIENPAADSKTKGKSVEALETKRIDLQKQFNAEREKIRTLEKHGNHLREFIAQVSKLRTEKTLG